MVGSVASLYAYMLGTCVGAAGGIAVGYFLNRLRHANFKTRARPG